MLWTSLSLRAPTPDANAYPLQSTSTPSLSIDDAPTNITKTIAASGLDTTPFAVTVTTDDPYGYQMSFSTPPGRDCLLHSSRTGENCGNVTDTSQKIPYATTVNASYHGWCIQRSGYACLSSGDLAATTTASGTNSTNLSLQVSPDTQHRAGTYSGELSFTALPNQVPSPSITSVSPASTNVGTTPQITITGQHFPSAYEVFIDFNHNGNQDNGENCTSANVTANLPSTTITCTVPAGTVANSYDVVVKSWNGTATFDNGFTYIAPACPAPTLTSASTTDATYVYLTGTGFSCDGNSSGDYLTMTRYGSTISSPAFTVVSPTSIRIARSALSPLNGDYTVLVGTPYGETSTQTFAIHGVSQIRFGVDTAYRAADIVAYWNDSSYATNSQPYRYYTPPRSTTYGPWQTYAFKALLGPETAGNYAYVIAQHAFSFRAYTSTTDHKMYMQVAGPQRNIGWYGRSYAFELNSSASNGQNYYYLDAWSGCSSTWNIVASQLFNYSSYASNSTTTRSASFGAGANQSFRAQSGLGTSQHLFRTYIWGGSNDSSGITMTDFVIENNYY
jgi:hypothetical protein